MEPTAVVNHTKKDMEYEIAGLVLAVLLWIAWAMVTERRYRRSEQHRAVTTRASTIAGGWQHLPAGLGTARVIY
ncbi:hypothetical protein OIU74_021133 [Salix koriyanagi]|uniref:Uncharacterized protein n=1 Tax=Salix koriyanagi TaxID=2511006 RepID=A0A9Q0SN80_9ROSI|nr:hypothetical protein OIU74_021133 [Salix koriyanagi]